MPDEVVREADQIEYLAGHVAPCPATATGARQRVCVEKVDAALANHREGNSSAPASLSLLWVADRVEEGLDRHRADHDITEQAHARAGRGGAHGRSRGPPPLRRRCADHAHGVRAVACVHATPPDGLVDASLEGLGEPAPTTAGSGGTLPPSSRATTPRRPCSTSPGGSTPARSSSARRGAGGGGMILSPAWTARRRRPATSTSTWSRTLPAAPGLGCRWAPRVGRRRSALGWLPATVGVAVLTAVLHWSRDLHDLPLDVLLFLLLTVLLALAGGIGPASSPPCWAAWPWNWFFAAAASPSPSPTRRTSWCCSSTSWWPWPCRPSTSAGPPAPPPGRPSVRLRRWRSRRKRCSPSETRPRPCCARWSTSSPWTAPPWPGGASVRDPWVVVAATDGFEVDSIAAASVRAAIDDDHTPVLGVRVISGEDRLVSAFAARAAMVLHRDEPGGAGEPGGRPGQGQPCPHRPDRRGTHDRAPLSRGSRRQSPASASTTSRSPRRTRRACSRPSRSPRPPHRPRRQPAGHVTTAERPPGRPPRPAGTSRTPGIAVDLPVEGAWSGCASRTARHLWKRPGPAGPGARQRPRERPRHCRAGRRSSPARRRLQNVQVRVVDRGVVCPTPPRSSSSLPSRALRRRPQGTGVGLG